jgi:hypothetical protein
MMNNLKAPMSVGEVAKIIEDHELVDYYRWKSSKAALSATEPPVAEAVPARRRYIGDGQYEIVEAISAQPFDFHAHLARQAAFSLKTFGPGRRTVGVCDHIRKELAEIAAKPDDIGEWIDVVILGLDGAWRCGGSPEQIINSIITKQTKNEGRVWPDWRTADPDKAIEHDRSHDAAQAIPAKTGTGTSIDTPEFRASLDWILALGYRTDDEDAQPNIRGLVAHINAYGQQQHQEGRRDAHETNVTLLLERDKMRERAEKAEAALATAKCKMCNGHGLVGCMTPEGGEGWPCPDCEARAAVADGELPPPKSPFSGNPALAMARKRAKGEFKTLRAGWGSCSICAGTKTTFGKRCVCTQTEMGQ